MPHYDEENINDEAPFADEESAIAAFKRLKKKHEFIAGDYVLVDVYSQ